jgi:hypothetical protein
MKWCFVFCVFCSLLLPASALDREAFTFTKYDMNVRLEPAQQRMGVRGTIVLRNDSATAQTNAVLQISSSMDWRAIRIHGRPVEFVSQPYTSDIDHTGALSEAIVSLPQAVPPHGTVELEIAYEGTIPLDATRLVRIGVPKDQAQQSDWDQISDSFTAVRGIGYVAWYPIATEAASLSDANDLFDTIARWKEREEQAEMHIRLSYSGESTPPTIFCNGNAAGGTAQEAGQAECSYAPLRMSVPLFVMGDFDELDRPEVSVFYLPADKADAESFANAAEKTVPFIRSWFVSGQDKAAKIPGHARFIELSDATIAPYENGSVLLTPLKGMDPKLAQVVAVHQLTHAAFYSPRPWIYEGLAHFAQAAYREQEDGRQAALDLLGIHLSAVADAEKAAAENTRPNAAAANSLINTSLEEFYRSKAAYVWWMLRDMVGESALKKALQAYRPEKDISPAYMQHLIEAESHRDLEWFFDDWVYRDRGLPDFRVDSIYSRPLLKEGYLLTVTVDNSGGAAAEVPVRAQMAEGDASKRLLVPAKGKASIRIEIPELPQEVIVNDGSVPESDTSNDTYRVKAVPAK